MVRQIIHIQVGQCGIQLGTAFWDMIRKDHKLSPNGIFTGNSEEKLEQLRLDKINVYYQEVNTLKFVPRACFVDLEPGMMDIVKSSPMGGYFKPDNMIFGASNFNRYSYWGKYNYGTGAELVEEAMDTIRREVESCNTPQGFQLTHSIGGGTGSVLGTLLLLKIRDNYPDKMTCTFSVFPSPKVSDVVVEPYNATLSIHQLLENSDETFVFDNEALFNISHNVLKQAMPKYADLNWIACNVMSDATASWRYPVELNGDIRKLGINLIPFPRLHFFLISHAPLFVKRNDGGNIKMKVEELINEMWSGRNFMAKCASEDGSYLSVACNYRGLENMTDIDMKTAMKEHVNVDKGEFIAWNPEYIRCIRTYRITCEYIGENIKVNKIIPKDIVKLCDRFYYRDNFKYDRKGFMNLSSTLPLSPVYTSKSGTLIANSTAIKSVFQTISAQFAKLYKRKAFLHWYKGEGMDEMEFGEADKNCRDLIYEYQDKVDAVIHLDLEGFDRIGNYVEYDEDDDEDYDEEEDDEKSDEDDEDF